MIVRHGPRRAPRVVVFAPGDAGRLSDAAPLRIARGLAAAGIGVVCFEIAASPHDDATADHLLATHIRWAAVEARRTGRSLVLAGLSRGARISAGLGAELGADAILAFGYPFHPRSDPDPGDRARRLGQCPLPVWLCQGTRDTHGNRPQITGYRLPSHIRIHWLEDANHALVPRARSGHTQGAQLDAAVSAAVAFLRALPPGASGQAP